jgi:serine/threonine protein kinase/dipeptidyl aminopeptidase/acylaminoacyl peptidase
MGEVYRAWDVRLERSVALKVLPESLSLEKERLHRFEKEARSASALNHPNIVTIYEVGTSEGVSYIAMELVEGKTLRELLHTGPLPLRRLLPLAAQLADGLAKAHEAGIVHRDLKPENVMVTKDVLVKILDFGLAKLTQSGEEVGEESELPTMTRATEPGTILGTVGYMSPEQASGEVLDSRSDQFSFGSILYEMATGKRAFEHGKKVQTLSAIITEEPEAVGKVNPKLPANFCWIVERCLAKEPEGRYASTKDLARDLAALRDHVSEISAPGAVSARPRHALRRRVLAFVTVSVAGLALFLAGKTVGQRSSVTPLPTFHELTFRRGTITGAAFAPDGHTIVYSAMWEGRPSEIFTTRLDSPESRPLGLFPAGVLSISSFGEMAVSLRCEVGINECYGTLARVPLAGGAPREILESVASADWAPDGKSLAVSHIVDGQFRLEYPIGRVLYESPGFLDNVRISLRGDAVAFIDRPARDQARGRVCVVDRDGHLRVLTDYFGQMGGLRWSASGDEILFSGSRMVKSEFNNLNAVSLSGKARAIYRLYAGMMFWDVSRDGRILMSPGGTRTDIVALTPSAEKEKRLSWFDGATAVDLSDDGKWLLFHEHRSGAGWVFQTYRRPTDGSDAQLLGEGKALALSPDGKWALAARREPTSHLVLLPTGTGQPRELPGGGGLYHWATWFPDGSRILFAAEEKDRSVRSYVQDVAGGPPRPFGEVGMRGTVVSPDGKLIAMTGSNGEQRVCPTDEGGSGCHDLPGVRPEEFPVQWSGDGRYLFVRGDEESVLTLYRVEVKTGRRELWKHLSPADQAGFMEYGAGPKGVRLTPDGKWYAYTYWSRLNNLYLVEGLK